MKTEAITARMSATEDPRHQSYVEYALADILIIMCAVLCGLDTLGDLAICAKSKADYLLGLDPRDMIGVSGLAEEDIALLRALAERRGETSKWAK